MRISARSRYGVRLMLQLALHYNDGVLFLKDAAKSEEISEKYLSQIVIPLKARGLLNSRRGATGGYFLARAPDKITVREIVEALEGGLNLLECTKNPAVCRRVSGCAARDVWLTVGEKIFQALDAISLEDLIKIHRGKREKVHTYDI